MKIKKYTITESFWQNIKDTWRAATGSKINTSPADLPIPAYDGKYDNIIKRIGQLLSSKNSFQIIPNKGDQASLEEFVSRLIAKLLQAVDGQDEKFTGYRKLSDYFVFIKPNTAFIDPKEQMKRGQLIRLRHLNAEALAKNLLVYDKFNPLIEMPLGVNTYIQQGNQTDTFFDYVQASQSIFHPGFTKAVEERKNSNDPTEKIIAIVTENIMNDMEIAFRNLLEKGSLPVNNYNQFEIVFANLGMLYQSTIDKREREAEDLRVNQNNFKYQIMQLKYNILKSNIEKKITFITPTEEEKLRQASTVKYLESCLGVLNNLISLNGTDIKVQNGNVFKMIDELNKNCLESIKNISTFLNDDQKSVANNFYNLKAMYDFLDKYDIDHLDILVGKNNNNFIIDLLHIGDKASEYIDSSKKLIDRQNAFKIAYNL